MVKLKKGLKSKIQNIQLVLTDVDGVLTDGSMYYSVQGEELKKFNTKDGMGVELLLKMGIKTIFISKESSKIASARAKKVEAISFLGVSNKESQLEKICKRFKVKSSQIAYIGDDINDLDVMKISGVSFAPLDAVERIQKIADYICKNRGGEGAFREMADIIIEIKKGKNYK